uniref:sulfurtransferase TusA family protein n=1 Tax=Nocardioides terrisoli TaxID=3388267 RepID=UPI0037CBCACF
MPCPRPIIELARHLTETPVGGILGVAADDPAAAVDVPAWCRMRSQEYAGSVRAQDGTPVYLVRRVS